MSLVRAGVKRALLASGHYRRRLMSQSFPGVAVLCYHNVRPDSAAKASYPFEQLHVSASELADHCELLASCCTPVTATVLASAITQRTSLPERPVLVTFDDGYRNVATVAVPILERYGIPAVFFACSASINERRLLWYDAMARRGAEADVARVKRLPFDEWRQIEQQERTRVPDDDALAAMTVADIRRLSANPMFEFGGHTATHPILAAAPESAQREEIENNLRCLAAWTGRRAAAFAYPNGQPGVDYSEVTMQVLRDLAMPIAFTTQSGFAGSAQPPLEQSRYMMLAGISQAELAHRLSYSWHQ